MSIPPLRTQTQRVRRDQHNRRKQHAASTTTLRKDQPALLFRLEPTVHRRLKGLAFEHDTTSQRLAEEALELLFQHANTTQLAVGNRRPSGSYTPMIERKALLMRFADSQLPRLRDLAKRLQTSAQQLFELEALPLLFERYDTTADR